MQGPEHRFEFDLAHHILETKPPEVVTAIIDACASYDGSTAPELFVSTFLLDPSEPCRPIFPGQPWSLTEVHIQLIAQRERREKIPLTLVLKK